MKQFGRQYSLRIGNNNESIEINNLRITFEISKTITSEPNAATIQIYNLNESHRNFLTSRQYNRVSLAVGYDDVRVIYVGDIIECVVIRDDLDFIVELSCGDGYEAYTGAHINMTLRAGTTDADILEKSLSSMSGVEKGNIILPKDRRLPRGKTIAGNARDALNKIAKNNVADWSIQDGNLTVLPRNSATDNDGFVLSQETGLIGSPEKTDDGLRVMCLLNPALNIGGLVRVQSILNSFNGDYKITELTHSGDILSDDWRTEVMCIGGEFQKVRNGQ